MQWFIRQDSGYRGPLDESTLLREYERGYVDADTLVSPDPTTWLRFADYPRLQALVEQRGHASIRPKPLAHAAIPSIRGRAPKFGASTRMPRPSLRRGTWARRVAWAILGLLLIAAGWMGLWRL